ncbi:bet_lambda, phage recombination protein Bet [uncultured Caudovirales phage]|uniref:Bet_lambda, phage recombination protein Bet n=1 Tax=uncultured Caudovirales phage TaxID=2100421 RepID=A0A6J5L1F7_9CAUD|nr:bet_lambda, phage recombination protein Bet [uncultured Caudovirales phage]CAB4132477.1 bet_lambda, phage recombination protein Bet [uncultured Caudovirales phage]CAB4202567.1 bet_lambda, phage recombination protein Bet [uncultured Caudovirales phage]CAB5207292.1 bet_lambda, phage recombination protein Bet [uncultured Caudovirales phage]
MNNDQELVMWDDAKKLEEIRKLFAPKLSDMEFKFFVGLGKASRLNPFTREIWAVKYQDSAPAQVFIGRDGYRKAAQAHSDYDFHQCDAVYENDDFDVVNGEVHHKYKLTNRGALVGAYCIAKRHKSSRPMYVFADLKEYSTGKSLWNPQTGKPATMIKKVAESQCLRACFQDLLGGTYGEEEFHHQDEQSKMRVIHGNTNTQKLKNILGIGENDDKESHNGVIDSDTGEFIPAESGDVSSSQRASEPKKDRVDGKSNTGQPPSRLSGDQLERIEELFTQKEFNQERVKKAFGYYKVKDIQDLDSATAQNLISQLERA